MLSLSNERRNPMIREYLAVSLMAIWFAAITVYQCFLGRLRPWVGRFDLLRIIPEWNYFRGTPMHTDFQCRFDPGNGSPGEWHFTRNPAPRRLLEAVWNPEAIAIGVVNLLTEQMSQFIDALQSGRLDAIKYHFAYDGLVHCMKSFAPSAATRGQFRIIEHAIDCDDYRVQFVSQWHVLDAGPLQMDEADYRKIDEAILAAKAPSEILRKAA